MKVSKKMALIALFLVLVLVIPAGGASANSTGRMVRGVTSIVSGVVELPIHIIQSTFTQVPPVGTIVGVVTGTVNLVAKTIGGVFDVGVGAAPYAKYAAVLL